MGSGLSPPQEPPSRRSTECDTGFENAGPSGRTLKMGAIKPNEQLVPVSFARYRASTPGLSTWWSTTALQGELVLREASRLDAFSGYPVRT
jgi:hypothetical protein